MGWESFDVVRFDLGLLLQVQMRVAQPKSAYSLSLVLEVCNLKPTLGNHGLGFLLMWSDLTLGPSFKVKRGCPNLKMVITCLLLVLEVWDGGLGIFWCGRI